MRSVAYKPLPCQAEAAKEIPGHGKVREIERRLASRLLEEVRMGHLVMDRNPVVVEYATASSIGGLFSKRARCALHVETSLLSP